MEKDIELEYAIYLLKNLPADTCEYIDLNLMTFEEFKEQFVEKENEM